MQRFANLRCLLAYQFASPGKKLLFMGTELAPWEEWDHEGSLNFERLNEAAHLGMNRLVRDLNHVYTASPCLYEMEFDENGLHWLDHSDHANSVMSFVRRGKNPEDFLICAFNFTPVARHNYRIAALVPGIYEEVINTDSHFYGGFGFGNLGSAQSHPVPHRGWPNSLCLVLPPLSGIFLRLNKRIDD
jgi:1,4-alpha-glucan branching enzyme